MNENFDYIYDKMTQNSDDINGLMSEVYQALQANSGNEEMQHVLDALSWISKGILSVQKDFAGIYAENSIKDVLVGNIDDKINALSSIEESRNKGF